MHNLLIDGNRLETEKNRGIFQVFMIINRLSGNGVVHINRVTLRRARLV